MQAKLLNACDESIKNVANPAPGHVKDRLELKPRSESRKAAGLVQRLPA